MDILNTSVENDIENKKLLKIELGGGLNRRDGYYNLDLIALEGVDIVADLNKPLSLLPDNSVEAIYSNHVLEHVSNLIPLMEEIHRITTPAGIVETVVPHFSNPFYYSDPTHVHPFGLYSMSYFVDKKDQPFIRKLPAYYSDARFKLFDINIELFCNSYLGRVFGRRMQRWVNRNTKAQEFYEKYLCRYFSARQIRFYMTPKK